LVAHFDLSIIGSTLWLINHWYCTLWLINNW